MADYNQQGRKAAKGYEVKQISPILAEEFKICGPLHQGWEVHVLSADPADEPALIRENQPELNVQFTGRPAPQMARKPLGISSRDIRRAKLLGS